MIPTDLFNFLAMRGGGVDALVGMYGAERSTLVHLNATSVLIDTSWSTFDGILSLAGQGKCDSLFGTGCSYENGQSFLKSKLYLIDASLMYFFPSDTTVFRNECTLEWEAGAF